MEEKRLNNKEEVDLRDYLRVIGKRKWTILITLVVCILFSLLFTFLPKPVYRIKSTFEIGSVPIGTVRAPEPIMIMTTEATAQLCKSDYLLNKVRKILGLPKKEKIKIKVESKGSTITISLESSLPEKAVKIVNTITNLAIKEQNAIYQEKLRELEKEAKEIQKKIDSLLRQQRKDKSFATLGSLNYLQQLQGRLNTIYGQFASFKESKIIFPATTPARPIKPRPVFNLAVSIILGCFLGIFFAFFQEYLSKT